MEKLDHYIYMGNRCTSKEKNKRSSGSTYNLKKESKKASETIFQSEPITITSTSPIKKNESEKKSIKIGSENTQSIRSPTNLLLSPPLTSSYQNEKFLKNEEEDVISICSRLTDNSFEEFILKERNITKILRELTYMNIEKLASLNNELVSQFQKKYFTQLKLENEKIFQTLNKPVELFSEVMNSRKIDKKLELFHKSFICFIITLHHIFRNNRVFSNLHESYYHKDCSRPVSNDKMFIEEKSFIYSKDLSQMSYIIAKGIVSNIIENIIKDSLYNKKIIHTIRDENFLKTWKKDHLQIFGKEDDHNAKISPNYLFVPKKMC